jgi:cytochrome c
VKMITRRLAIAVAALCVAGVAVAQERGTKDEAKAMVDAALAHIQKVGKAKALDDFTHDKADWTKKDLYVMAYDTQGIALAHGGNEKLVGKNLSALKDGNGKLIIAGLQAVAAKGGGWFDYDWPDPLTKKLMPKSTYARELPGGGGWVGVGIYR